VAAQLPPFKDIFFKGSIKKVVPSDIARWLHPIAIAYWFAGDGGKFYFHNHSKSLAFHTPREKTRSFFSYKGGS
jgi:hypothetical protein